MTILLYKNGQLLIDAEQPLEGVSLDNLAAFIANPQDGDVLKYDAASGMWIAGKDSGSVLPEVTASDKGKYLKANESTGDPEWADGGSGGGVLVVHEVDGALDKTYKQIVDALHTNGVILELALESGTIMVYLVTDYGEVDGVYPITFHTNSNAINSGGTFHYYFAESENGYPVNDDD